MWRLCVWIHNGSFIYRGAAKPLRTKSEAMDEFHGIPGVPRQGNQHLGCLYLSVPIGGTQTWGTQTRSHLKTSYSKYQELPCQFGPQWFCRWPSTGVPICFGPYRNSCTKECVKIRASLFIVNLFLFWSTVCICEQTFEK